MNSSKFVLTTLTLWVTPNVNPELTTQSSEERLADLHYALRRVHAGLWINTKPRQPRFESKPIAGAPEGTLQYRVVYTQRTNKEEVLEVAKGFGFSYVPDPEPVPNLTVTKMTSAVAA